MTKNDSLLSLLQFLGHVSPKRSGSNYVIRCPFADRHKGGDKNPSFTIEIREDGRNRWNCFSCGIKGVSLRSFALQLERHLGGDFSEWYGDVSGPKEFRPMIQPPNLQHGWYGVKKEVEHKLSDYADVCTKVPKYVLDRGVTIEQARRWHLGFDEKWKRLFIPVIDHTGTMVGYSTRAIFPGQKPKYMHSKHFVKEKYFYGEEYFDQTKRIAFLSEGFMDVWSLERAGVPNALAFMGTGVGEEQRSKLWKWVDIVVIFPHNDKKEEVENALTDGTVQDMVLPGTRMANEWKSALESLRKRVVIAPFIEGKKDVGDWSIEEIRRVVGGLGEEVRSYIDWL